MKKSELIEELSEIPGDPEVFLWDSHQSDYKPLHNILYDESEIILGASCE